MSDENEDPVGTLAFPLQELAIAPIGDQPGLILSLKAGDRRVSATLGEEALSEFAMRLLDQVGSAMPSGSRHEPGIALRALEVGLKPSEDERFVVLLLPIGQMTLAVEVPVNAIATQIGRHLAGQQEGSPPPTRN